MSESDRDDIWYRIGYALEEARSGVAGVRELPSLRSLAERPAPGKDGGSKEREPGDGDAGALPSLLSLGSGALAARLLGFWPARYRPGALGLLRAGAAGAGCALLVRTLRPFLGEGQPEDELAEGLAEGVARGLLYAAVVEPRVPLPALLQGALYGSAEYLVSPWGGLTRLLGKAAPHRKLPLVGTVLRGRSRDEGFVEHVAFAVAVAVLYQVSGGASGADAEG